MRFGIFYEHQLPRPWGPALTIRHSRCGPGQALALRPAPGLGGKAGRRLDGRPDLSGAVTGGVASSAARASRTAADATDTALAPTWVSVRTRLAAENAAWNSLLSDGPVLPASCATR